MPPRTRSAAAAAVAAANASSTSSQSTSTARTSSHLSNPHANAIQIAQGVWSEYVQNTPQRVKLLDAFLGFLVVVGAVQFAYCCLAGSYPFNAFLSGFSAAVGQFVLTVSLRMQTDAGNSEEFGGKVGDERAFADFIFGSLILHFFCVNFIN